LRASEKLYTDFESEIESDVPAIFVYTPDFIYLIDSDLLGVEIGTVVTPAERFLNVHEWHLDTQKVWPMFAS